MQQFKQQLPKIDGFSFGSNTNFSNPINVLRTLIINRNIKELLVVFITDGDIKKEDKEETKKASDELKKVLQ